MEDHTGMVPGAASLLIRPAEPRDRCAVWDIIGPVIQEGETYAYPRDMSQADALARWHAAVGRVAFVIGSADGLAPSVRERARAVVSLSSFTLPHALVRVILAEQIYRAVSLNAGHPYHRE